MSLYLIGTDVLGADATVHAYTDVDTVRAVQQWLAQVGGGKAFTSKDDGSPLKVDGVIGPDTRAALKKFNGASYRNHPEDEDMITDGTLASMGIQPSATPAEVIPKKQELPADGRPAKGWSQPQPDKMGPAITPDGQVQERKMPGWKIALLVALGVLGVGSAAAGVAIAARGRHT